MSISGDYFTSAEGMAAAHDAALKVLQHFVEKGVKTPLQSKDINVEGIGQDQIPTILGRLETDNLLSKTHVEAGFFNVSAFVINRNGERLLEKAEGQDSDKIEKEAALSLLRNAQDKGPHLPEISNVSQSRQNYIVSALKKEGCLKDASVQKGFYKVSGITITEEGKKEFARQEGTTKPNPKTDINGTYTKHTP